MRFRLSMALLTLMVVGCGPPETCVASMSCARGGKVQACSSSAGSRYKCSDGTVFACMGTGMGADCSSAAREAGFWCSVH